MKTPLRHIHDRVQMCGCAIRAPNYCEPCAADRFMLDALDALRAITKRYCDLANSGDCGFWDPETEDEVKLVRAAIAALGDP